MKKYYKEITARYTFSYFSKIKQCEVESSERVDLWSWWLGSDETLEQFIEREKQEIISRLEKNNKTLASFKITYISDVLEDKSIKVVLPL